MLKDRVIIDENGFKLREGADPERKAYYVTFTLADGEMEELSREFHGVLKRNRHMVIMRI